MDASTRQDTSFKKNLNPIRPAVWAWGSGRRRIIIITRYTIALYSTMGRVTLWNETREPAVTRLLFRRVLKGSLTCHHSTDREWHRYIRLYVLVWEDETMESKESCLGTQRGGVTALQWNAVKCITDRNPASAGIRYSYARSSAQSAPQNETQPSSGFESGRLHLSRTELTEVYSASITTPPCLFIKRFFQSVTSQKVAKKYPLLHNFAHKPYSRRPTCCFNKLIDWNSIVLKKKTLRVNFTAKYNGYVYISDIHTIGFGYKCCNWAPYVHGGIALVPVPMFLVLLLKRCLKNVRSI
jgi:hypothetical protein